MAEPEVARGLEDATAEALPLKGGGWRRKARGGGVLSRGRFGVCCLTCPWPGWGRATTCKLRSFCLDFMLCARLCKNSIDRCYDSLAESSGDVMKGFVQGSDRQQTNLLPECLDDWVDESNPVRAVDVFVDALELRDLGFHGCAPAASGRPAYHPSPMLKLYIYGYLNRVQST